MKLLLVYKNGTRYSYKGFTVQEIAKILWRIADEISAWDCSGVDVKELFQEMDKL